MDDYNEFPPIKYLTRVLKYCPKSALLYVQLWDRRDKNLRITLNKNDVRRIYMMSPTVFRNTLAPLTYLNLIQLNESADGRFQIEIMGPGASD